MSEIKAYIVMGLYTITYLVLSVELYYLLYVLLTIVLLWVSYTYAQEKPLELNKNITGTIGGLLIVCSVCFPIFFTPFITLGVFICLMTVLSIFNSQLLEEKCNLENKNILESEEVEQETNVEIILERVLQRELQLFQEKISSEVLKNEIRDMKSTLSVIQRHMIEVTDNKDRIEEYLEKIIESNKDESLKKLIEEWKKESLHVYEEKHIQSYEIKNYFEKALISAQEELCIISPWVSKWILEEGDVKDKLEKLLIKGVNIKILYGIESGGSFKNNDLRNERTDRIVNTLVNQLSKKHTKGKLIIKKINTHYKLLICDDQFYIEGSMNFLSNKGDYGNGFEWHEGARYSENKKMIQTLKDIYFNL